MTLFFKMLHGLSRLTFYELFIVAPNHKMCADIGCKSKSLGCLLMFFSDRVERVWRNLPVDYYCNECMCFFSTYWQLWFQFVFEMACINGDLRKQNGHVVICIVIKFLIKYIRKLLAVLVILRVRRINYVILRYIT